MGPDEYHDGYPDAEEAGLHNNAYTNLMVVWLLRRTREALDLLPELRQRELREKLGIRSEELARWQELAGKMLVPFHGDRIISQFEGYDDLEEFDWVGYTERYGDIHRLDRILEAEGDTPNRYKVSKQADVLMLFYLLSDDEIRDLLTDLGYDWDEDLMYRNVKYYLERTSHGSTLSRVVHSWVLARADRQWSWRFFEDVLLSDVRDIQGGTTAEGIHLGAMAGSVDLVQRCYTGLETRDGVLRFDPVIPEEIGRLAFDVRYRGVWVTVDMTSDRVLLTVAPGPVESIRVAVCGKEFDLVPGASCEVAL
jgi:alpha,alpha-trehalase